MAGSMYQPDSPYGAHDALNLAYCGLLILYLVGILVRGCSGILEIYARNIIGVDEFLISGAYLDLLLFVIVICPTIGCGSLYQRCIVPLRNLF